jgi:hypothetical protein
MSVSSARLLFLNSYWKTTLFVFHGIIKYVLFSSSIDLSKTGYSVHKRRCGLWINRIGALSTTAT